MTRVEQFDTQVRQFLLQIKDKVENSNTANLDYNQMLEFARAKKSHRIRLKLHKFIRPRFTPIKLLYSNAANTAKKSM